MFISTTQFVTCRGGWVLRWCWVSFLWGGILLILLVVGQGPTALAVGVGGGLLVIFTLIYLFSPLSPSLWETARYRLKYCLKARTVRPKTTNQPTSVTCHVNFMKNLTLTPVMYTKCHNRFLINCQSCKMHAQGEIKAVICGKYINLNKITKI